MLDEKIQVLSVFYPVPVVKFSLAIPTLFLSFRSKNVILQQLGRALDIWRWMAVILWFLCLRVSVMGDFEANVHFFI